MASHYVNSYVKGGYVDPEVLRNGQRNSVTRMEERSKGKI